MKAPKVALILSVAFCAVGFKLGQKQPTIQEVAGHNDLQAGQLLSAPRTIQNGAGARVQVGLRKSVFRLGANGAATVNSSSFELESGTCLFADLADEAPVTLVRDRKFLQIVQGSGFAHRSDERLIIGGMAGKTVVNISGHKLVLRPGEVITWEAKGDVVHSDFDLARQVSTCALINDFTRPLPNAADLRREAARFASLEKRGFVRTRGEVVHGINQRNPVEDRLREAQRDFTVASSATHNPRPSPSAGGIIERDGVLGGYIGVIDNGFPERGSGGGTRSDDDDGPRPVGTKPGHGHGEDNHDHSGPPGHGAKPGKGNKGR